MDSNQRVKKVINGEIPDEVPWGEFAIDFDTVEKILGHETFLRAKARSKVAFWEGRRDEVVQSWKEDIVDLYQKLEFIDIINFSCECMGLVPPKDYIPSKPRKIDENTWEFSDGRIYKYSDLTGDVSLVYDPRPVEEIFYIHSEEDTKAENIIPPDPSIFEVIDAVIDVFGGKRYIIGPGGEELEAFSVLDRGKLEQGLMEIALNPERFAKESFYSTQKAYLNNEYYIRPGIDGIMMPVDYAGSIAPFMSPDAFRKILLPNMKDRIRQIHDRNMPVFKHACGNNKLLLDMFIEAGVDCYQSLQKTAGMDLKWLKQKYGSELVLWGGLSVENLLSAGPEEVEKETKEALCIGKRGGKYIFGSSHSIAKGTKYENFMKMVDTYLANNKY